MPKTANEAIETMRKAQNEFKNSINKVIERTILENSRWQRGRQEVTIGSEELVRRISKVISKEIFGE